MKEYRRAKQIGQAAGFFALGAAAGSVAALLMAPASGRVTRRRIGLKVRAVEHAAARRLQHTGKLVARRAITIRDAAAEQLGNTREWLVERVSRNGNGHARQPAHR